VIKHKLVPAIQRPSPNFYSLEGREVSLLVVHCISLPPGQFGGPYIDQLFTNRLDPSEDPFFEQIHELRVASHLLIRRDGEVIQYVDFDQCAHHAGKSSFDGREKCNDFSIGIELEGTDQGSYTDQQYDILGAVSQALLQAYPRITKDRIVGHSDIAPGRKTDPGVGFDWNRYYGMLSGPVLA